MRTALLLLFLCAAQDDAETKLKEFADVMKAAKSDADKIKAIHDLAATRTIKAAAKITTIMSGPFSASVRVAAADAVGRIGDVRAGPGLQAYISSIGQLLQSENPNRPDDQKVAEAAVRALGTLRDHSAIKQLSGMTISANIPLMAEVCRAMGKIRDPGCMDALLKLHYAANSPEGAGATNPRKPLMPDTLAALRRITGQKLTTPDEWNKWYKSVGGRVIVPPEESLGGLPPEIKTFAVYTGKGEIPTLRRYDLVFLNPDNYTKDEINGLLRPIALSGDPKAVMDKGFAGFVCEPEQAAELRKKFPRSFLIARGGAKKGAAAANAILAEDLDLKKTDDKALEDYKDAYARNETMTLAIYISEKKEDGTAAAALSKKHAFLLTYVAPNPDHSALPAP